MKTIFRSLNFGLVLAALFALGAVAGIAQDACTDADAITAASNQVREGFANYGKLPSFDEKQKVIDDGKAFAAKYASCEPTKALVEYINTNVPAMQKGLDAAREKAKRAALENRFINAVKAKSTDEILAAGKEMIAYDSEAYRPVELALASLGYDESILTGKAGKYAEESLRYGRQAISDLEGGKAFRTFDLGGSYSFTNKEDALAWMNATVGYLTFLKDMKAGLPFIYKATQAAGSTTNKEVILYSAIGDYYKEEARKLTVEITNLQKSVPADASQDVIKQTNDTIAAKEALSFGYAERGLDAYARAFKAATTPPAQAAMKKKFSDVYQFRFEKTEGVDAWIAQTVAKPFPNPLTPVEPVKVETTAPGGEATTATPGSGIGAANGTGVGAANGSGVTGTKSTTTSTPVTTPAKSTTTPAKPPVKKPVVKRSAAVKKPVAKKNG